jgi:diguanylate cyclase (GGDEF)-like protein/PAS domain S-box-containing protein
MTNGEKLLTQVLANVSDGVYFVDRRRRITYWSPIAERITGYREKEVVGSHCYDNILRHVNDRGRQICTGFCPLQRAIRQGKNIRAKAFLHHKDGHRIPILIKTFPRRNAHGRITGAMEIFSSLSSRTVLESRIHKLEKLALVDSLTRLTNRRFLEMTLRAKIEQARRYAWKIGVIFMDIDNFKVVNDTWGHSAGDKALRAVAGHLLHNSRSFDTVGRWGGEEFLIISDNVTLPQIRAIAERYRALIHSSSIPVAKGRIHLTISAGATLVKANDTLKSLVERVDQWMYRSKHAGRNRVTAGL